MPEISGNTITRAFKALDEDDMLQWIAGNGPVFIESFASRFGLAQSDARRILTKMERATAIIRVVEPVTHTGRGGNATRKNAWDVPRLTCRGKD